MDGGSSGGGVMTSSIQQVFIFQFRKGGRVTTILKKSV